MMLVLIESPFAGKGPTPKTRHSDKWDNIKYARDCMRDCFDRGEAPYASHLLYTQPLVLDDDIPGERTKGIEAGLLWGAMAEKTAVYVDRGISKGMFYGIQRAEKDGREVEYRTLEGSNRNGIINKMRAIARAEYGSK